MRTLSDSSAIVTASAGSPFESLALATLRRRSGTKWSTHGPDVLPAWVADMDFAPAPCVGDVLSRMLACGDLGYPPEAAGRELADVFASRAERFWNWAPDSRLTEALTDVMQGVHMAIGQFSGPGDGVVILTPIYPPFLGAVRSSGRRAICHRMETNGGHYRFSIDDLRRSIDASARILLLSHPHNPTGRVFTRDELAALAALAIERDLIVVSDEIHADLIFSGHAHIPLASLSGEIAARTITLTSATKAFNIAGLRCALALCGSAVLHRRFADDPRGIRGKPSAPGLAATVAAWRHGDEWLTGLLHHLAGNRELLARFVEERMPGVTMALPQATFLAWLDCRALPCAANPWRHFLERARVALGDGREFGAGGAGFVRLNFATSRAILGDILERMAASL